MSIRNRVDRKLFVFTDQPCLNGNSKQLNQCVTIRMSRPPVNVDHLLVGVTGGFQPDKLARSFDGDADGLYARVLFAWPAEASYRPLTDTIEEVEPEFENALTKLIDVAEFEEGELIIRYVNLARDAVATFEEFRKLIARKMGSTAANANGGLNRRVMSCGLPAP